MNQRSVSVKKIMDTIVPISRFNRGEAAKIFDEVNEAGVKIVLRNNTAVGVLVKPERYEEMVEMLEDYALYFEAEKRLKNQQTTSTYSQQEVLDALGIDAADLEDGDVEIEA